MADQLPNSRTSRTRQAIAIIAWICLVGTAFLLWNARQTGLLQQATDPGSASFLAAFAAFVSVFAWMLFNPNQSRSSDSLSLFAAAAATLFPPPIIAFNLIATSSPLRWWVAFGIFALLVIAILSHVPDEFFGVPRGRSSYIMPLPVFDRVENSVMDPNASWFKFNDLRDVVDDRTRPSLAPRAYLQQESLSADAAGAAAATYTPARPISEVDDILGSDFDLGLLDDPMLEMDLRETTLDPYVPEHTTTEQRGRRSTRPPVDQRQTSQRTSERTSQQRAAQYPSTQTTSYQQEKLRERKTALRRPSALNRPNRQARFAASLKAAEAGEQLPPTTFQRPPVTPARVTSSPPPQPVVDPLDETPLQQREDAARSAPVEYLQQTNRDRAQRHRARRGRSVGPADQSAATPSAVPPTSRVSGQTESPTAESTSAAGRSIFGIPLPFGRSATEPTDDARQTVETATESSSTARTSSRVTDQTQSPGDRTSPDVSRRTPKVERSAKVERSPKVERTPDVERTQDAHGGELVEGVMTVRFDKGQKRANLHIPFSPPLPGMPEVECECVDDVPVRLKVPVRQSYGIRIEARRSDAAEALETDVGFAAVYSPEG